MKSLLSLKESLLNLDGKGYKQYKEIKGKYFSDKFFISIDHVQGDPYAAPSKISIRVKNELAKFPKNTFNNKSRAIALRDFLNRSFYNQSKKNCDYRGGADKSGLIEIYSPGQEILERSSVEIDGDYLKIRILMGLPAKGRRIDGIYAVKMFLEQLSVIIENSLFFSKLNSDHLYKHINTSEDADVLRDLIKQNQIIAFAANNSLLPRKSGIDEEPMDEKEAILFKSPSSMQYNFTLPNKGNVSGMGIKKGITLIVGGGYHGKSTLLKALEKGIYNHIPGDGRELVVTDLNSVKIRAEDGRRVEKTTITPFISNLPYNQNTDRFCTEDASGSTSQAANIIEMIEIGAQILMIDEDTSATNFMIRDFRMQELVAKNDEPITPFIDKVKQIYLEKDISTILVMGGSGDYFDIADNIICMHNYLPIDVTIQAKNIAKKYINNRHVEGGNSFGHLKKRIPAANSINPQKGKKESKISARGLFFIQFGNYTINLAFVEQLVEIGQTSAIGDAILYARRYFKDNLSLVEIINLVMKDITKNGLNILNYYSTGNYALFRKFELAAAINRLRSFKIQ